MTEKQASSEIAQSRDDRYRVEMSSTGCTHCGGGNQYAIVADLDEPTEIGGMSWGDEDTANDICELMNTAYAQAERDTRERVAQLVQEYLSEKVGWSHMGTELAERIRGKVSR